LIGYQSGNIPATYTSGNAVIGGRQSPAVTLLPNDTLVIVAGNGVDGSGNIGELNDVWMVPNMKICNINTFGPTCASICNCSGYSCFDGIAGNGSCYTATTTTISSAISVNSNKNYALVNLNVLTNFASFQLHSTNMYVTGTLFSNRSTILLDQSNAYISTLNLQSTTITMDVKSLINVSACLTMNNVTIYYDLKNDLSFLQQYYFKYIVTYSSCKSAQSVNLVILNYGSNCITQNFNANDLSLSISRCSFVGSGYGTQLSPGAIAGIVIACVFFTMFVLVLIIRIKFGRSY